MAVTNRDASAQTVSGKTYTNASIGTDGLQVTGPAAAKAIYAYISAAGTFEVAGGDAVPLDASTWTVVWERGEGLPSSPSVLIKPSSGTATISLRIV